MTTTKTKPRSKKKFIKGVFKVGDRVIALKDIRFMIGCHIKGNIYCVNESNVNYFNVMCTDYELLQRK